MSRVLVTGGGAVSLAVAHALLGRGDDVVLWLHARDRGDLERRAAACPVACEPGLVVRGGDLRDEEPFAALARCDRQGLDAIVHAAALTRFTASREDAEAVNVEGTRRVLELARTCDRLEALLHVSSVHAAGLAEGAIAEAPLAVGPHPTFANEYERSKRLAEDTVVAATDVPWRLARLGTIVAADDTGGLVQQNALHVTLRLMRAGLLPLLPGGPTTPAHLVTARAAGESCARLLAAPSRTVAHVTAPPSLAPPLAELLALAHARIVSRGGERMRRLPLPALCDLPTFEALASGADGLASALVCDALRCLRPFAAQLLAPKTFLTTRSAALLGDAMPGDPRPALLAVVDALESRRPASADHALAHGVPA